MTKKVTYIIYEVIFMLSMGKIEYYPPQTYKNLTVFGIRNKTDKKPDFLTLDIGLDMGLVEITELDDAGVVSEVIVKNNAVTPLLILDGEEVIGSKQNRIFNSTIIIEAKTTKKVNVSCTEAGRWSDTSKVFVRSDNIAPVSLRRGTKESVLKSLRHDNLYRADQSRVWSDVALTQKALSSVSETSALSDTFTSMEKEIEDYLEHFKVANGQNGCIVIINNKIAGMEYVCDENKYLQYHKKIIKSYILDALKTSKDVATTVNTDDLDEFVSRIDLDKMEKFNVESNADDYRLDDEEVTASVLVYDDNIINVSILNKLSA
ncbi:MAG: hypothetical protein BZ136_00140 [Methanosphaera sp. rholeuAM74]|nr:MAG: hypothetical protein BZ136_00140 [Methanosphaera sp. rholeuAM74]